MQKYRIIVVDDEETICHEVEKIVNDKFSDKFMVVQCFYDGLEALNYIKNNDNIDVLISDIKMPGCSGLDLAKHICLNNLKIKTILITGYRKFEYAKDAVGFGVRNFLTKPLNFAEIINCLQKIYEERTYFTSDKREIENDYTSMLFRGVCRKSLVSVLRDGKYEISELSNVFTEKHMKATMSRLIFKSNKDIDGLKQMFFGAGEICTSDLDVYFIKNDEFGIEFFGFCFENEECANEIFSKHCKEICRKFCAITGGEMTYQVQFISSEEKSKNVSAEGLAENYYKNLIAEKTEDNRNIIYNLQKFYINLDIKIFLKTLLVKLFNDKMFLEKELMDDENLSENLPNMLVEIEKQHINQKNFNNIIEFINLNISADIDIVKVADKFHFNKSYFSRLFKQKIGKSFTEYLIDYRIEIASKMLKETDLPITTIAKRVGLRNQYFYRVFKNKTGETPKEYRERFTI